ncbi:YggT family protein [Oceaniserpentilla sp. 4NH20-0058]|uniref:YggT family protein n=1 Tax=Oceaniserpentilla sp. 4NH20-0058 TaxID=3127660 RepID=UPI003109B859
MGSASVQIGLLLVNALAGFFLFAVLLRFVLQAARADFYNPISQFVVKATNPLVVPLRKIIPGIGGLDWAAIVLMILVQILAISLSLIIAGYDLPLASIATWALLGTSGMFLKLYFWGLLIMIIASWLAPQSYNPALLLLRQIMEPVMAPIRKVLPDMGGLDLSPIVLFLVINVFEIVLISMARETGAPGFIIGL